MSYDLTETRSRGTQTAIAETAGRVPVLLTRPEAAERLAISVRALDEQIARGRIAVCRIGKSVRFSPAALDAFIQANEAPLNSTGRAAARRNK